MDRKKLINDIILVGSLLIVAAIALIVVATQKVKTNLVAKISVGNEVVEVVDLSKEEDKHYFVDGVHGKMHIHTYDGKIAVLESNCPHQDCVRMGYVSDSNHPIICAYNQVTITINGNTTNDVEIG